VGDLEMFNTISTTHLSSFFNIANTSFLTPKNFVFLVDKSVLNCEIRIDDRIDNLDGAKRKLLNTAYHNKDISNGVLQQYGIERAEDWLDVKRLLLKR